jgi:putative transposase
VSGRKRHLAVDTLGLVLGVRVHPASDQDRYAVRPLLREVSLWFPRVRVVFADAAYAGRLVWWVAGFLGWVLAVVRRSDSWVAGVRGTGRGFEPLPKRWVVERTFAWLMRCRRLSRDYEQQTRNSETMIRLAMIGLMARRVTRPKSTS